MEGLVKHSLENFYGGKKVLITGHTGFKGSWLSIWLHSLGAEVVGIALEPKTDRDNFVLSKIGTKIKDYRCDIRDREKLASIILDEKPEIVFHLAAQPLVLDSYEDPVLTYETNIMGTIHLLESIRKCRSVKSAIFITTDKVYENKEWIWPYREDDVLGGYDPYSSSKGASEIVIASYRSSFFNPNDYNSHGVSIATARAGNVIGGGDWADNRIVPDCIRALEADVAIEVRNPSSVRPWQHVLEPLGGYLMLGMKMHNDPIKYAESWNFGPEARNIVDVKTLVEKSIFHYRKGQWEDLSNNKSKHEAKLLALDINKAKFKLNWNPILNFDSTIKLTIDWYKKYNKTDVLALCLAQINEFQS